MLKVFIVTAALMVGLVSGAGAQSDYKRPGATGGGRIGALCSNDMLHVNDQKICFEKMKAAKTDAERDEVRAIVRAKIKEQQTWLEEERGRRNAVSGRGDPR